MPDVEVRSVTTTHDIVTKATETVVVQEGMPAAITISAAGHAGPIGPEGPVGPTGNTGPTGPAMPVDLEGNGRPEGTVTAIVGKTYRDNAATNGAILWVKASGTGNTGWRVVWGDTGWRDLNGHWETTKVGANYATYQVRLSTENGFEVRMKTTNIGTNALVAGNYKGWVLDLTTSAAMFSTTVHTNIPIGTGVFGRATVTDTFCTLIGDKKIYLAANCFLDHSLQLYLTARPPTTWPTALPGTAA